jgi:hypothetical protein
VCAGEIVEEREILSKFLLAKADRKLFSLVLQLVRVPLFDLQSGKVCDSLSAFFFGAPCSFSFPSLVLLALKQSVLRCVICIFLMVYGCVEPLVGGGVFGL